MDTRAPQAGGFLMILCIFIGGWIGLQNGSVGRGLVFGTAAGIVVAVAVWLIDRARRRS